MIFIAVDPYINSAENLFQALATMNMTIFAFITLPYAWTENFFYNAF